MPSKSVAYSNKTLNYWLSVQNEPQPPYVQIALYTDVESSVEVDPEGTGYERVNAVFGPASSGSASNALVVTFAEATAPWGNIQSLAIVDNTGAQIYAGPLGQPKQIDVGDQMVFAIGAIVVDEA